MSRKIPEDHQVVPLLSQVALVHTFNAYGRPGKVYGILLLEEVHLCQYKMIVENLVNKCHYSLFLKVKPLSAKYHHKMCDEGIGGGVHILENLLSPSYLPYLSFGKIGWMWHSFNGSEHGSYSPGMAVFIDHGL
jgi:hypothetical protein